MLESDAEAPGFLEARWKGQAPPAVGAYDCLWWNARAVGRWAFLRVSAVLGGYGDMRKDRGALGGWVLFERYHYVRGALGETRPTLGRIRFGSALCLMGRVLAGN